MDKSLIRSEPFLGNTKTIVGDKMADLVLETLGKVYIKFGRSTRLLNDLFTLLDRSTTNTEDIKSKIIIVNSEQELKDLEYPGDGYFIYNSLTSILYLSYQREYVPLVNASEYKEEAFVKKSGDTMSGPLEINTSSSPLIIASKALVDNLNVEFLGGYGSNDFAKKRIDEIITGSWTFQNLCTSKNNWIFKNNIRLYKDIVSSGSISTPKFAPGFTGYGWRLDGNTNTLTIDYLVVRKAMKVFEMVINQISATNGSLWVSNSSKCASTKQPIIVNSSGVIYGETDSNNNSVKVEFDSSSKQFSNLRSGEYYIFEGVPGGIILTTVDGNGLSAPSKLGITTIFKRHFYLFYINDSEGLANSDLINSMSDLYNAALSDTNPLSDYITIYNTGLEDDNISVEFPAYVNNQLVYIKPYYKYFGMVSSIATNNNSNNYWIIETDEESYPLFKQGDIIRCQKYSKGNIKYYDALVLTQLTDRKFLMQKATSVFDIYTEISYEDDGSVESMTEEINKTQYEKTNVGDLDDESVLDNPAEKDDMIQIGNIKNIDRQNAIYLTSTDDQSPYIDIISGLNRPDYSVIYNTPKYIKYVATDPNTKCRRSYYVSTVSGGIELGKFRLDQDTNEIIQKVDDSATGSFSVLYGYDYPTSVNQCLIQKENGSNKYEYTKTTKVRLGKLDGIYNSAFGNNQPYGFGLYGENVFLTGEFYLNNGKSVVEFSRDQILLEYENAGMRIVNGKIQFDAGIIDLDFSAESVGEKTKVEFSDGTMKFYHEDSAKKDLVNGDKIIYDAENDKTWVKSMYLGYGKPKEDIAEEPLLIFCDNNGNDLYNIGPSGMFSSEVKSPKVILSTSEKKVFKPSGTFNIKNNNFSGKFGENLNYFFIYSGNNDVQKRSPISVCNPDGSNLFQYPIYVIGSTSETYPSAALIFESVNAILADDVANNIENIPDLTYTYGSDSATKISPLVYYSCETILMEFFSIKNIDIPANGYPTSSLFPFVQNQNRYHFTNNFIGESPFILYSQADNIDDSYDPSINKDIVLSYVKPNSVTSLADYHEVFWSIIDSGSSVTLTPISTKNARAEAIIIDTIGLLSDIFSKALNSTAVDYIWRFKDVLCHAYYSCPAIGGTGFSPRYLDSLNIFKKMYSILMNTISNKETTLDSVQLEPLGKFTPTDSVNIISYSNNNYSLSSNSSTQANISITKDTTNIDSSSGYDITKTDYTATASVKKIELNGYPTNYGSLLSSGSANNTMLINIGVYYSGGKYCLCYDCGEDLDDFYTLWTDNSTNNIQNN